MLDRKQSPLWLTLALLLTLVLSSVACGSAAPSSADNRTVETAGNQPVDSSSNQPQVGDNVDRTGWPDKVRLGLIPTEANVTVQWEPVVTHLEEKLGLPVETFVGTDYTATIVAAKNNKLDIVWLGPKSYVTARTQGAEIEPVAKWINQDTGIAGYNSLLITHKNTGITTMEEARGHSFAFNDPESTSGFLVPSVYFLEHNITPEDYFSEVFFAGSHEATALAVANERVEVASNNNETLPKLIETGKVAEEDIVILWESPLIPTDPISVQKSLPPSFHEAVRQALLEFDDRAALDELSIDGWVSASDADYDVVRTLEETKTRMATGG